MPQASEPALASNLYSTILAHNSIEKTLAFLLANKLASPTMLGMQLLRLISDAYEDDPALIEAALADLNAVYDRDPACDKYSQVRGCAGPRALLGCARSRTAVCLLQCLRNVAAGLRCLLAHSCLCLPRAPLQAMLYFKGYQSVQCQRVAHWLWGKGRRVRRLGGQRGAFDLRGECIA